MTITHWSNGGNPSDWGWVIDGENWTGEDLMSFTTWDEMADCLPEELVEAAKKSPYGPDEFDVFMLENYQ
jgi:hypothetical protein